MGGDEGDGAACQIAAARSRSEAAFARVSASLVPSRTATSSCMDEAAQNDSSDGQLSTAGACGRVPGAPASYASATTWKFAPPNPNELTAARRGTASCALHCRA